MQRAAPFVLVGIATAVVLLELLWSLALRRGGVRLQSGGGSRALNAVEEFRVNIQSRARTFVFTPLLLTVFVPLFALMFSFESQHELTSSTAKMSRSITALEDTVFAAYQAGKLQFKAKSPRPSMVEKETEISKYRAIYFISPSLTCAHILYDLKPHGDGTFERLSEFKAKMDPRDTITVNVGEFSDTGVAWKIVPNSLCLETKEKEARFRIPLPPADSVRVQIDYLKTGWSIGSPISLVGLDTRCYKKPPPQWEIWVLFQRPPTRIESWRFDSAAIAVLPYDSLMTAIQRLDTVLFYQPLRPVAEIPPWSEWRWSSPPDSTANLYTWRYHAFIPSGKDLALVSFRQSDTLTGMGSSTEDRPVSSSDSVPCLKR